MKALQLNSSIRGSDSISSRYADLLASELAKKGFELTKRDLAANPVTTLNGETLGALFSGNLQHPVAEEYTQLINELKEQDALVIAVPMYNFSIPTQLKNYFDAVARAGVTFSYTANGPVGLLKAQKAYLVFARGGKYNEAGMLFQEQYLETFLKFLGVKEVEALYIEGLNMGSEVAQKAQELANTQLEKIFA